MTDPGKPISEAKEVSKSYSARVGLGAGSGKQKSVQAVDRASIRIEPGESVGLVGESGCGKSSLGRLLLRLETPTDGQVWFDGEDITRFKGRKLRKKRRQMQMIFQDPASSLNPRFTVEATLREAITAHKGKLHGRQLKAHIAALLNMVGLPITALNRQPHEFSGGEKQRISIARALAVEPKFLIADEPVTSLDLASQGQILNLLETVKRELQVAFLFIAHDMDTVKRMCAKTAVMYLGRIVETAPSETLFRDPKHPYTRALMLSQLSHNPDLRTDLYLLPGEPPSPLEPPTGCHFHPRCPYADIQCKTLVPEPRQIGASHIVRCHFNFDGNQKSEPQGIENTLKISS
ncbi:MAG: ABC transporter ATP-binding protein [Deltaproteobacteria bacterium]|nr:ABC transporter ATP-binding protein [Deltaproteobacteria bacterium]MBN2670814.1 ABC transporter ATP-binding protein [Deltaproteobacteria bacterium]